MQMSGERRCGKTLSCYALLITYMKENFDGLIIPALHLSPWFQDTSTTQMIHTGQVLFKFILLKIILGSVSVYRVQSYILLL